MSSKISEEKLISSKKITNESSEEDKIFVLGTSVSIDDVENRLTHFFRMHCVVDDSKKPLYIQLIEESLRKHSFQLSLDCMHLHDFDPQLYSQLIKYPMDIIPLADLAARNIANEITSDKLDNFPIIHVRPYNLDFIHSVRDLEPRDVDRLVSVRGLISRV